ncbi:MAG: AI-2E family transporter [Candidatus Roizmanbacteria bacterium]|nr:AI-2E family transporter [Candidatus Roizmanbacteria bacterium]
MSDRTFRVEVTARTILFTVSIILLLYTFWFIRGIIFLLFAAFTLMSALRPIVDRLEGVKIPRIVGAVAVMIAFVSLLSFLMFNAIPPLVVQMSEFFIYVYKQTAHALLQYGQELSLEAFFKTTNLPQVIPNVTTIVTDVLGGVLGNIFSFISLIFFTVYLLVDIKHLRDALGRFLSPGQTKATMETAASIEQKLGAWVRGQAVLMIIIGVFTYIGLTIVGVPYALPLAIIAGFLELFPYIGPILSTIPAFFVAVNTSWLLGVAVIALYLIVQQLENNVIVPVVMRRAVGIPPLFVLLSLMIGQKLFGFAGVLLAVPIVAAVTIVIQEVFKYSTTQKTIE